MLNNKALTVRVPLGRFFIIFFAVFAASLLFATTASAAVNCADTGTTGVPQTECEALMAIYNNTVGTGWTNKTNWDTASAVSTWYGITVSGGHVTAISINGNNVRGSFPSEIGNLPSLVTLNMYNNSGMSGSIPSTIGNLTNLVILGLSNDNLSGSIPTEIGNCTKLQSVLLHVNSLSGAIPSGITNWTALSTLYLYNNSLTGAIPTGFPSTLRNLRLQNNQLSGTIPSGLASIPLTSFYIQSNRFVFSDFESQFTAYVAQMGASFTYSPQASVDTTRSATFTANSALTITPSVSANANDVYQWYKDTVAISGATSRVYTKTAADTDNGVYYYTITNSVVTGLTLTSANITLTITPNPPAGSVYYIINGTDTWVRGAISTTKDIAQKYTTFGSTNNTNFNFSTAYIINSATPNTTTQYATGTAMSGSTDDAAPIYTNNNLYFGGNHGLTSPVVTSTGHDKTAADIGSTWSDGSYQFILASISGNNITFYSVPHGSPWTTSITVAGTLTHVSGATHTGNITVTSQTSTMQYPAVKNVVHHILANGSTELSSGDQGYATYVEISEEFDIVDPSTMVTNNSPWVWNDTTSIWMHVTNTYTCTAGTTIVHSEYSITNPMNLGYFGILQVGAITDTEYDHQYYYVPKTKPVSGYDFETHQILDDAPASTIYFNATYIDDITNPPDRQIIFKKRNEDSNYDIAFAFGYSPYGATAAASRNCLNGGRSCWWIHTTKKSYPEMVNNLGVINNVSYDAYAYRQWVDPTQYNANKIAYWNEQNGRDIFYVDYHSSVTNDITTLPSEFYGKAIKIIDSSGIDNPDALVPENGNMELTTTGAGTYGYAVFEFITPPSVPTSPIFSAASSVSSLTANWTWGGSSSDNGYTLDISAANNCSSFSNVNPSIALGTTTYAIPDLSPNTSYCFRVAALSDSLATSAYATSSAKYTLANTPTAPTVQSPSTSAMTVIINTNSNPTTTTYAIQDVSSENYVQADGTLSASAVWQTYTNWGGASGISVTGLSANTSHQFKVKAKNGDAVETALSSASTATYTLANAPGTPTTAATASTSLTITINQNSNSSSTTYAIQDVSSENYVQADGTLGASAVWQTYTNWGGATGIATAGLTENTAYQFKVKAKNGDSATTNFSTASSALYTLAATPTSITATSYSNTTAILISANTFTNPTAGTSGYYFSRSGANSGWISANSWEDSAAVCGNTYTYSVKYRNGNSIETSTLSTSKASNSCVLGGTPGGWSDPPATYSGSVGIKLNYTGKVPQRIITVNFNAGPNTKKMSVSLDKNFFGAVVEPYSKTKELDICPSAGNIEKNPVCPTGQYTIYAKLFTESGVTSETLTTTIQVTKETTQTTSTPATQTPEQISTITPILAKNWKIGNKNQEIVSLQKFLNQNGFKLADNGAGSPGNETDFFGSLTRSALTRFQEANRQAAENIISEKGFLGDITRKLINSWGNNATPTAKTTTSTNTTVNASFTDNLYYGQRSDDVARLQTLLSGKPEIYPEKLITGFFGKLTLTAVQNFQLKYSIVTSAAEQGFGVVGPKTRAKLQEVFGQDL